MISAVADTHALLWFLMDASRLSPAASAVLEAATGERPVGLSAISLAEVVYLEEKGRLPQGTFTRIQATLVPPSPFLELPVTSTVVAAMVRVDRSQVPDFPDRLIAATALAHGVPLVTRDARIRGAALETVW